MLDYTLYWSATAAGASAGAGIATDYRRLSHDIIKCQPFNFYNSIGSKRFE